MQSTVGKGNSKSSPPSSTITFFIHLREAWDIDEIHPFDIIGTDCIGTMRELASVCKQVIERDGMIGDFPFDTQQGWDFAEAFIQKGIVVETDRGFEVAIASMGDWAHKQCQRNDS